MRDTIELRGLRALCFCGALAEEQARPQPLELDLDIVTDLSPSGKSDSLGDTIDYSVILTEIERILIGERFGLLEYLAQRVAAAVLADERVIEVTVAARKLRPPVHQQVATCGVRITRGR